MSKWGSWGRAAALLVATGALATASAVALHAQENGALRGTVDPQVTAATKAEPAAARAPAPTAYVPSSMGAESDDDQNEKRQDRPDGLFGDIADPSPDARDETFSDADPVAPVRRSARAQAANDPVEAESTRKKDAKETLLDKKIAGVTRVEATERQKKIELDDDLGRVEAIDSRDRIEDDDPFAPVGVRLGSFILRPSIEQGVSATSNANYSVDGESAILSETTLRLDAASDWSRHSASLDAYGNLRETIDGYEIDEKRAGVDAALNLDLAGQMRAIGTLRYERRPETASSPVEIEGAASQPIRQTFGGALGLEKDVGKARYGVTALIEHEDYGDADLDGGNVLTQNDRNSTLATVTIRGGYEISPAFTPFVEAEIGKRYYDQSTDSAGYSRDSDRLGLRTGIAVDLDEKIVGEVSGGWIRERFQDDRLRAIDGPSLNAAVTWSPERETSVRLAASTTVESATDVGESGSILHSGLLSVERRIRADLSANAALGLGYRDYTGLGEHDILLSAEVGGTWWLNRYSGITGRLRHERQESDPETRNYDANSIFLGLKVQR